MSLRAGWLVILLAWIAGCEYPLPYRQPCEPDAAHGSCCPSGSHEVFKPGEPGWIVCGPDEDAGAGDGACDDADAH